jgi:ribonuclease BN (tRNA processing enzyme)
MERAPARPAAAPRRVVAVDDGLALTDLTFLGTGNYLVAGGYWSSFVIDGTVLVEPSPTALPHLRRCGVAARDLDVVVISHFHADHTFGWPFLLLELVQSHQDRPLTVVGPPQVERHLVDMLTIGGVPNIAEAARSLDLRYVEVDGSWQRCGALRLRAVEVEHVDHLRCFGYLFDRDGRTIGYSGDTRPCAGLTRLAEASDVLVLECNDHHAPAHLPRTHMDVTSVRALQAQHPDLKIVLTHRGPDVAPSDLPGALVPGDFDVVSV